MLRLPCRLVCFALSVVPLVATADESVPSLARKVFDKHKQSIVTVTGVAQIRLSAPGNAGINFPEKESKVRGDGTIVDSTGLVVVSLSAIDPSRLVDGREQNLPNVGPTKLDASATVKELEIILGDGTEIPASLVFKDVDLDLAFVRPKADAPEAKDAIFDPIDLADSGAAQVADSTVTVTRQEDHFDRAEAVLVGQLTSVIERPRPLYLATNIMRGCPMFNLDGKLLGIGVVRMSKTQGQAVAVVPAAEVRKAVEQISKAPATPDDAK